jgi:hypothetical protein
MLVDFIDNMSSCPITRIFPILCQQFIPESRTVRIGEGYLLRYELSLAVVKPWHAL